MINYLQEIKVIGFDLDQTLYPKSPEIDKAIQGYIFKKIAQYKNISLQEAEKLFSERYRDGKGMGGSSALRDLGVPNASDIVQEALERADIATYLTPAPQTLLLLERLREKYQSVDLITASNQHNTLAKLDSLTIPFELFTHALTSEDGSKSNGDSYRAWLAIYPDIPPERFLYIGDRQKSDYEIPHELGIHSILVNIVLEDPSVSCPQLPSLEALAKLLLP